MGPKPGRQVEANPELANQFYLLYLSQGLLRGPCNQGGRRQVLTSGGWRA